MAINSISNSDAGSGAGQVLYSFSPVSGAEYVTPLTTENTVYLLSAKFTDPQNNGSILVEIYADGNLNSPRTTATIYADRPFTYSGPINRIKVLSDAAYTRNQTFQNYGILTIAKYANTTPARTNLNNDGFGDVYVHMEAHSDWQTGSGYGWNDTRRWVGWAYNWDGTGVYRAGRSNEQSVKWQYKPHTSQTWQTLTSFPADIEFSGTDRLTRAEIYDTQNFTYVIFRLNTTTGTQTVNNTVDNVTSYSGTWNVYLARYDKTGNSWKMLGAYNITTYGDPSHTWGPQKFFIAQDSGGNTYLYPWQRERTANSFFRYNLTTGARTQIANAANAWEDGAFVGTGLVGSTSLFMVSPTQTGVSGADSSAYDYQGYNPITNTWSLISAPSRTGEGSLWNRGGLPFRYSATEVGVIGRRTYTSNNTAPSSIDRFYGRRMWKYNVTTSVWTDISADLGLYYPHVMRPSPNVMNNMRAYQPQSSDWNGRFLTFYGEESGMTTRGNYRYVNAKAPRQVQIIGQTGRARGEMSVGSNSVLAFGHMNSYNGVPVTFQSNTTINYGGETIDRSRTGGWEIVYLDGSIKYGPSKMHPQNVIYDPTVRGWYATGWQFAFSKWVSTTSATRWERVAYFIDEKTGEFWELSDDFYSNSADRGSQEVHSSGLAYTPGAHFIRPYSNDYWIMSNLAMGGDGNTTFYYGLADYTWTSDVQPTDTARNQRSIANASGSPSRNNQIVAWGVGPRNVLGIPEGTLFWDGRTLRQYSFKLGQTPFTTLQTGWRIVYTSPNPNPQGGGQYYGSAHVWRDQNYAICPNVSADHYYVFDLQNLYTSEPKVIGSHLPNDTAIAPANTPASSTTISGNSNEYASNKACVAGVEIIYGHQDYDGVRSNWFNDTIYIVRDPMPSATLTDDKNA
jgi:hypothetical protein